MKGRPLILLGLTAALLAGAAGLAQYVITPVERGVQEQPEQVEDSGPVMDLEHLREEDLVFLEEVLATGEPKARQSAARALAVSGDARGVPLLFGATRLGDGQDALYCMAALEILRLQQAQDAWRELVLALDAQPPLPRGCRSEVQDRFALVDGADPRGRALEGARDSSSAVRAWAARALLEHPGDPVDEALLALAGDEDLSVRRAAWQAWQGRDGSRVGDALSVLASREADPELRALALEVASSP
jgi:HEAT repeat protein